MVAVTGRGRATRHFGRSRDAGSSAATTSWFNSQRRLGRWGCKTGMRFITEFSSVFLLDSRPHKKDSRISEKKKTTFESNHKKSYIFH